MAPYKIFASDQFAKELEKTIPADLSQKLRRKLEDRIFPQLREEPHFGANIKKLRNYTPESWRYRVWSLRFFYSIDEKKHVVIMTAVRLHKEAYR